MAEVTISDYGKIPNRELAHILGISEAALRVKAHRLGLGKSQWSDDEILFLEENRARGYRYISEQLGRSYASVKLKAQTLHLPEKVHIIDLSLRLPEIKVGKYNLTRQEYINKRELIHSMCGPKKTVGARKTVIGEVDSKTFQSFLEKNHLEGRTPATEKLGLYLDGKLLAVAGFMVISGEFTLVRFCSLQGITVVGGLSKLLAPFKDRDIVTFSDFRYSEGDVYYRVGFERVKVNKARLYFTDGKLLYNRRRFQKKYQQKVSPETFNPKLTERENAELRGYRQIFLGGTVKWVLRKSLYSPPQEARLAK